MTVAIDSLADMSGGRVEQRALLRSELPPADTTLVVRGGRDTADKLRGHAERTATHFTVRLDRADDRELEKLLAALGSARPNPQYARTDVWREEG